MLLMVITLLAFNVPVAAANGGTGKTQDSSDSIEFANDPRGTGVSCTHIAPGPTRTNFFNAAGLIDECRMAKLGYSHPHDIALIGYRAMHAGRTAVMPSISNKIVTWLARISPSRTLTGIISAYVVSRNLD
ncbi:hypothetical protein T3A99_06080 [Pseudomonas sp. N-137]|uniref:hypothetical protein n=1 Tax=Pseudomonas sp. N-137 TaxID=3108452 RepID=UPI002ADECCEE|nr:hypothetical protein [Pseudomonas sp. N-137]MEA1028135.1 hypothetical protein [Pseudomonas sp. N-137]